MYKIERCPCCNSKKILIEYGVIAPFISEYVLQSKPQICHLATCLNCKFKFFLERFSEQEGQKLYSDYRGKEYFFIRNKYEPWYTLKVNEMADGDPKTRKILIETFLRSAGFLPFGVKSVLDYGGDQGKIFPDTLGSARKFLYDISNRIPNDGVTKLSILRAETDKFDMIMLCNILEHISEPDLFIQNISRFLSEKGYIYIEVPFENFRSIFLPKVIHYYYLKYLLNMKYIFKIIDFISVVTRLKFKFLLPLFGIIKLHEHISFYTIFSLKTLIERHNFSVLKIKVAKIKSITGRNYMIQCLAKV